MQAAAFSSTWWIIVLVVVIGAFTRRFLLRTGMTKKMATGVMIAIVLLGLVITAFFAMSGT